MFSIRTESWLFSKLSLCVERLKLATLVLCAVMRNVSINFRYPLERDGRHVAVTHNDLSQIGDTMI